MNDDKDFFDSMNPKLSGFYEPDHQSAEHLFPIQEELQGLVDKFQDSKKLASGSMKEIFEVKDLPSGRKVAKAKLRDSSDPKAVESFLREARLTASLQHPNIIRIYDIAYDDYPWFSMELIEGQSLEEKIQNHRNKLETWPLFERLDIFNKICDAIAYAHSKNVLHLDIKPENIRLGRYGEVIVCDWGLGHILYSDEPNTEDYQLDKFDLQNDKTMHGYFRGTPGYMAPERMENDKSPQADIFSLGALLYTLLNGYIPFAGKNMTDILKNTTEGKVRPASSKLAIGISSIYTKALQVDSSKRYSSVEELKQDINKFREGYATIAENAGFLKQLKLLIKRNTLTCSIVLAFILLISFILNSYISDIKRGRKIVMKQKEQAEKNLVMYKAEQKNKEEIARHFSALLVEATKNNLHGFELNKSLKHLNYAVKQHPENAEAWLVKGYAHFIGHQFAEAHQAFEKSGFENEIQKAKAISAQHMNNQGMLNIDDTLQVIKGFGEKPELVLSFFFIYDGQNRAKLDEHSQLVKYYLEKRNKAENFNFIYAENSLDVSNNSGLFYVDSEVIPGSSSFPLFKFLNLKTLNLSNTNFSKLDQLQGLKLESLDISHSLVLDLRPLLKMPSIKKVVLSQDQSKMARGKWPFQIEYSKANPSSNIDKGVKRLLSSFEALDLDRSGELSMNELLQAAHQYGERELKLFLKFCDKDKNGSISVKEINTFKLDEFKKLLEAEKN
ncbi:serine/threonine-protein kinase [Lentisphaera araneosa HTCC2155]|uniref:Serine/threonine-protein kinase n=1 Tax=Lentisphaera araneosa HTCC2155 TaxID=313628 RepID=A6DRY1_9BACT|nr:protein kinase [Lentisphaera araneosa]EDM25556.1 serine/threonine-protein kinase [Lentisphaera araneosa HTCC2155]